MKRATKDKIGWVLGFVLAIAYVVATIAACVLYGGAAAIIVMLAVPIAVFITFGIVVLIEALAKLIHDIFVDVF